MSRVTIIITLAIFLLNCQAGPLNTNIDEAGQERENIQYDLSCQSNNQNEDCALVLKSIDYTMPDVSCQPYDLLVQIDTEFFTPAGLGQGTTTKVEWEFLPKGNGGFWITDLETAVEPNSNGTIQVNGCFSFGNQQTLVITRTITDENGNQSNALTIEIENPTLAKTSTNAEAAFEFRSASYSLN